MSEAQQLFQVVNIFSDVENLSKIPTTEICFMCNAVFNSVVILRKLGMPKEFFRAIVTLLCSAINGFSVSACSDIMRLNVEAFSFIIDHKQVTAERICGLLGQHFQCPVRSYNNWNIDLPPELSPDTKMNQIYRRVIFPPSKDKISNKPSRFKILHISDIHYDINYTVNASSICKEPICCQAEHTNVTSPNNICLKWGTYRVADSPWQLIEEAVAAMKTQNFDYLYFTGDIVSHRSWDTSTQVYINSLKIVYEYLRKSFDVPIFPVLGNHEAHPFNLWTTSNITEDEFSQKWLYELAAEQFSLLVGANVTDSVLRGGYYTVSPQPGFRIIALNNNIAYIYNLWLLYEDFDPNGQLKWLIQTLTQAEENDEKVHILMHIPPGSKDLYHIWAKKYLKIVDRFSDIITGQFVGHTHLDEWNVIYSRKRPRQATSVVFNGGSITPYISNNPNFKIFDVNALNFTIMDYDVWSFDLSIANSQPNKPIDWYKLYKFSEIYGSKNLHPSEMEKILYRMLYNPRLLHIYQRLKSRNSVDVDHSCDDICKKKIICDILTPVYGEKQICQAFLKQYDITRFQYNFILKLNNNLYQEAIGWWPIVLLQQRQSQFKFDKNFIL